MPSFARVMCAVEYASTKFESIEPCNVSEGTGSKQRCNKHSGWNMRRSFLGLSLLNEDKPEQTQVVERLLDWLASLSLLLRRASIRGYVCKGVRILERQS